MSYSDNAIAFSTLPVSHQVRFEDRVSFAYIEKAVVLQNRTGVWAMQEEADELVQLQIQLPVGGIAVLALGPGTSITHPAMMSLTRSGATVVFAGGGGNNAYAAATPLTSSSRWALAQAHLVTREEETKQAAIVLYKQQLGLDVLPGGSINTMRGLEGRAIRDLYKKLAKQHGIKSFRREVAAEDPVNTGLNLGNSILYGCAAAACSAIGVNPALGIIHRGNRRSLLFDLADLYKPKITIPAAFASAAEEDSAGAVRRLVRKAIHKQKVMAGMVETLMTVLSPHLPGQDDDRLVGDESEIQGHTNYGGDE
ncbi:type I-E CRISPR-associated endonuclease Cas1 [Leucobacter viscericola]|uniref:CRISPR-associated endonuclease Cas1 n=1 Tax=Leucobacter viscericola TaxID=2714935 RepID=A0A6G7XG62_9MICO|nr:type I-E CRISPR-associated endonuclease Cas1e [Leucobacter viscericola]QIK63600.1 type I-E CRISPR-associated endonuclease Cas1 [Leucobacter viscericola]